MNIQTWQFSQTGTIPGIPGEWHAGLLVDIDLDTNEVIGTRLMNASATSDSATPAATEEPPAQPLASNDEAKTTNAKEAKE